MHLRRSKIHAEDCFECQAEAGFLNRLDCEIELTGSLTPDERLTLFEIAEKCLVHRTLTSEINIRSSLTEANKARSPPLSLGGELNEPINSSGIIP